MSDLQLACRCGAVTGIARDVRPTSVNHVVCYCDDCQAFARAVGRPEVLDDHGGSCLVQMSPGQLEISGGLDQLACLRLTPGGMVRWYTACCQTPFANTMPAPRPTFIGLHRGVFVDPTAPEALGAIRARVMGKWATGDRATLVADRFPIGMLARASWLLTRWTLSGARGPLRGADGGPLVAPRVLTAEELTRAKTPG